MESDLISVSDKNTDTWEEIPGTCQTVAMVAAFTKHNSATMSANTRNARNFRIDLATHILALCNGTPIHLTAQQTIPEKQQNASALYPLPRLFLDEGENRCAPQDRRE